MTDKSKELVEVIAYSKAMLRDAEDGNWDSVVATETKRNKVLNTVFSQPLSNKELQEHQEKILQILAINKKLEVVTAETRENIRKQAGTVYKGRHAISAYAQNAG